MKYKKVLKEFNKHGVMYVVLRNYDFLIDNRKEIREEIDLSVTSKTLHKAKIILKKYGFTKVHKNFSQKHT